MKYYCDKECEKWVTPEITNPKDDVNVEFLVCPECRLVICCRKIEV